MSSLFLVAPLRMARKGLERVHSRYAMSKNFRRQVEEFKGIYGRHPLHISRIWKDFQTFEAKEFKLPMPLEEASNPSTLNHFFWALEFLKVYCKETKRSIDAGADRKQVRERTWFFVDRLGALKGLKIRFPSPDRREKFFCSVDGTHDPLREPTDPYYRVNRKWYSKKLNTAGLTFEIALDLWENQIIHVTCGDPASTHDLTIFKRELAKKIPEGKRVIADRGYYSKDYAHILATPNALDSPSVKSFKRNARARHEHINARLSQYECLKQQHRHGVDGLKRCFIACVVMIQYTIEDTDPESGEPLNEL